MCMFIGRGTNLSGRCEDNRDTNSTLRQHCLNINSFLSSYLLDNINKNNKIEFMALKLRILERTKSSCAKSFFNNAYLNRNLYDFL